MCAFGVRRSAFGVYSGTVPHRGLLRKGTPANTAFWDLPWDRAEVLSQKIFFRRSGAGFPNIVDARTPNAERQTRKSPHPAGGYSFIPHRFIRALFTAQRTIGWCAAIKK